MTNLSNDQLSGMSMVEIQTCFSGFCKSFALSVSYSLCESPGLWAE